MAAEPKPIPVQYSERLFSEEVAIAASKSGEPINPKDPGYEFSNGRRFDSGLGAASTT